MFNCCEKKKVIRKKNLIELLRFIFKHDYYYQLYSTKKNGFNQNQNRKNRIIEPVSNEANEALKM